MGFGACEMGFDGGATGFVGEQMDFYAGALTGFSAFDRLAYLDLDLYLDYLAFS